MNFKWRNFLLQSAASLFIAFVIWLIAKQSDMDTSWVLANLTLQNVPANIVIDANPREVQLNVQYPREMSNRVVGKTFEIPINAAELFPGDPTQWSAPSQPKIVDYNIQRSDIRKKLLTQMSQIITIDPPTVKLTGRLLSRVVPIEVRTTNTLPNNLVLTGALRTDPPQVAITGPRENLDNISKLYTTIIDLAQITGSMQAFPRLILPPGVRLLGSDDLQLTVDIGVSERIVEQTIVGVPITYLAFSGLTARVTPTTADVIVEGPASAVATISPDDISFTPARDLPEVAGKSYEVGIEARLKASVPADTASQITIRECRPPRIAVEFITPAQQNTGGAGH
jgi:YbbR domain-containing protein